MPAGIWVQVDYIHGYSWLFWRSRFIVIIYGNDEGVILELDLLFTETPARWMALEFPMRSNACP